MRKPATIASLVLLSSLVALAAVAGPRQWVSAELQEVMKSMKGKDKVKVNVVMVTDNVPHLGAPMRGTTRVNEEGEVELTLGGASATREQVTRAGKQRAEAAKSVRTKNRKKVKERVAKISKDHGLGGRAEVSAALESGAPIVTLELTKGQITALAAQSKGEIEGIELWREATDETQSTLCQEAGAAEIAECNGTQATLVKTSALDEGRKGSGVRIYYTECGCADAGHVANYTKIQGQNRRHAEMVLDLLRSVSPDSEISCAAATSGCFPTLPDPESDFHIVNRSNNECDVGTRSYSAWDKAYDDEVYDSGRTIFVAAGNNGGQCASQNVRPPARGLNVVTTGAYDHHAGDREIGSFSAYLDPQNGPGDAVSANISKPEVSAPGVEISVPGVPRVVSGTSFASPHAAAFAANLMGTLPWLKGKPYLVKARMMNGAWGSVTGGADKTGVGGLDFHASLYNHWCHYWEDPSWPWAADREDIPAYFSATSGRARVTMAWLTRGTYTYQRVQADESTVIGMNLDLEIIDPNGKTVGRSESINNAWESVEFDPEVTGNYTLRIEKGSINDAENKFHMALCWKTI